MTGPWISGESLSPSRLNVHGGSATLATGFSTNTLQPESGTTVQLLSDLSVQQTVAAQRVELGGPPSNTSGLLALRANSAQTDYLFLQDATGAKSNFLLGLRTGDSNASQVDGLNLYDTSHNTTLVRFSSDSIRFYPPIIAPVFDTGGALAGTYNAALYLRGSSKESQIQAAINAAAADGIPRVYVPANLYPYSAASVSFDTRVQMVREGGNWTDYDVKAYGAAGNATQNDTTAIQAALNQAALGGSGKNVCFVPTGNFLVSSTITVPDGVSLIGVGRGSVLTTSTALDPMLYVRSENVVGNRYGIIEGIALQGGSIASVGLLVESVQRTFRQISIERFQEAGLALNTAQNSLFEQLSIENNGAGNVNVGAGIRLNMGAASNVFIACELSQNAKAGILSLQSAAVDPANPLTGLPNQPGNNTFYGCIIERGLTSTTTLINLLNSRGNRFIDCTIAPDTSVSSRIYAISISSANGTSSSLNEFIGCFLSGPSGSTAARVELGSFKNRFDRNFIEGWQGVFEVDNTNSALWLGGLNQYSLNASTATMTLLGGADHDTVVRGAFEYGQNVFYRRSLVTTGSASRPAISFIDDSTIGWYSSGSSTIGMVGPLALAAGSATAPTLAFSSETSLGFYRSANSVVAQTYGTFAPSFISMRANAGNDLFVISGGAITTGVVSSSYYLGLGNVVLRDGNAGTAAHFWNQDGTATSPAYGYASEVSLGFYRSGNSTTAHSYGTLNLNQSRLVSVRTQGSLDSTTLAQGELAISIAVASGASLALRSGNTIYYWTSSASTKG